MFDDFAHYLSYGSTDQATMRDLTTRYDGLIVPGTIAAFQAEGTRGFVLSLSAAESKPYAIDPRSPLFQTQLSAPKKSHSSLATLLGVDAEFGTKGWVPPEYWDDETARECAVRWVNFNSAFTSVAPKAFDKYAKRLGRTLPIDDASGPRFILAPYLAVDSAYVNAEGSSRLLWRASQHAAEDAGVSAKLRRVFAYEDPADMATEVLGSGEREAVLWVSDLDEFSQINVPRWRQYVAAVRSLAVAEVKPFALYGGYLSVVLRSVGLVGASHGVGFSEHRNHVELNSSGAAPARYYSTTLHRYLAVDLASELWRRDPELVVVQDGLADSRDPQEFTYHELMKHSVRSRSLEIAATSDYTIEDHATELRDAHATFVSKVEKYRWTPGLWKRIEASSSHLPTWASIASS